MPQEQQRETASLSDYAAIIVRRWRVVVASALVFMVLGALYSYRGGATYTSNASLVIRPILSDPFGGDIRIEDVGADTQAKVLDSTVVASTVVQRLKLDRDPKDLIDRLTVENPVGTLILNIAFTASTAERAQAGAEAFTQAYLDYRRTTAEATKKRTLERLATQREALDASLAQASTQVATNPVGSDARTSAEARRSVLLGQIGELESKASTTQGIDTEPGDVIRPADLPSAPAGTSPVLTVIAATILGAIVGVGLALLRDRTDRRVRSRHDLVEITGQEPLVEIPRARSTANQLPAVVDPAGVEASVYRALRVRLWPRRGTGPRRLLIAAATEGPAADAVGANLAVTVASSGWQTLLAWPNKTDVAEYFSVEAQRNVEVLVGERPIERLLVEPLDVHGLTLMPALARTGPGGVALETTTTAESRLAELGSRFDTEIIVGAPVLASAESIELCPLVDAVLVVFDPSTTTREELVRTLELLDAIGAKLAGIVTFRASAGW
jgi:succinoglycan biosynthesis transport protein ExoP